MSINISLCTILEVEFNSSSRIKLRDCILLKNVFFFNFILITHIFLNRINVVRIGNVQYVLSSWLPF